MNLGFAHPGLLWGLLAAAIPLAIHLFFRRRPRPTPFPAVDFILRARRETQRRLRLKKILLFSARTLLLGAIATAIARPRAEQPGVAAAVAVGPRATAIVLDASGSMRYRLEGRTLFERALADAREALAALGPDEPATVVVCGAEPPAAEAPSFDHAAVRRVLDRAAPGAGHSDLTACVQAAAQALSAAKAQEGLPKRIVVATDLCAHAWRLEAPPPTVDSPQGPVRPEVSVLDAARGAPLPNRAVMGLEAEPDPAAGPRGYKITATLVNHGQQRISEVPLSLLTGVGAEQKTAIRAFTELPAGGAARKSLLHSFPAGGPTAIQVAMPGDALPLDDALSLTLDVPRDVHALVVDGSPSPIKYRDEAYFVESALASPNSPVRPHLLDAEALGREDLARYDVVFLLNVRSVAAKAADLQRFVENGGGLFLSMGDQVDPDLYARELGGLLPMSLHVEKTATPKASGGAGAARFAEVDFEHPALRVFTGEGREGFLGTRTFRYLLARPAGAGAPPSHVLAAFDDGAPALVEGRRGKGRVLLFTSSVDRDWTDWPIRTSFLPAMQRFAAYLSGGLEERRQTPTTVGTRRMIPLPEGEMLLALVGPDGREHGLAELTRTGLSREAEGFSFAPPEPGLWQVKVSARGEERLDAALAFAAWPDPRESDTRRLDPAELTAWFGGEGHAKVAGEAQPAGARELPLWSVLLMLGLAAFAAEGLLVA
ncbi:MAG TPA: BatA domain-containing protein [Anaeromyxobacter sp.]|nr:BatA domain-containing protein [Anaeromyxobacter sp.]